jgi:hypothetical protein
LFILCAVLLLMAGCALDGIKKSDFSEAERTSPGEWRNETEPGTPTYEDYKPSAMDADYEGWGGANHRIMDLSLFEPLSLQEGIEEVGIEEEGTEEEEEEIRDASGNDPRDFNSKFMPYYRYTKLENEIQIHTLTMFGMFAFNPRFAMTYEIPVMQHNDYEEWELLPPGVNQDDTGVGDANFRFFLRPKEWEFSFKDGTKDVSIMPLIETTVPTATEDGLGGDAWILSPGFVFVTDMPFESPPLGLGFLALMNFYDFELVSDETNEGGVQTDNEVSRFRGRWFWMQPLSKPAFADDPDDKTFHIFDTTGLYMMTEFQPVYDFREDEFSFWYGPEFGKIIREGNIIYFKPGWGIDNDKGRMSGDREFTFEFGWRYFF